MSHAPSSCPSCGAPATGRFCGRCGAPLASGACPTCGAALEPGARFCSACGASAGGGRGAPPPGAGGPERRLPVAPLAIVGVVLVAAILVLLVRNNRPPEFAAQSPVATGTAGGGVPDLSQMTPREAFDRLYNRVMAAAEQGDTTTVAQFSPMALQAYGNLDAVDADARYHAAMLRLHTGDVAGASALADSILAETPNHLFGFVLQASIARFEGDEAARRAAYSRMLEAWDAEMRAGRPEYQDHSRMLEGVERDARAVTGGT